MKGKPKLIIIRGQSGSGKSTLAKELRKRLTDYKTALLEQDYLRRHVLGELGGGEDGQIDNIELMRTAAEFCLKNNYITIIEGIMHEEYYGEMLSALADKPLVNSRVFYLDIPFEETLKRHATKPNNDAFGENQMKRWYREKDYLNIRNEVIITSESTLNESIELILNTIL